ncbi:MAG: flagellar protein FlgN [Desulfuromonadaceae bacterium]|nr:flagellar protein FlgN [Desulfuromonadaceae bacterium]MDD2848132.1 flagellar protein FlgN [Desulfuromonadaceae bacterium]MDD4132027.1 flagellar protein FlgN [Desulfuromonadaceae bacterium]
MELKKMLEEIAVQTQLLNELLQVLERETAEMGDVNINAMNLSNRSKEELTARIAEHTPSLQKAISAQAVREGLPGSASLGMVATHIAKRGNRELIAKQQQIHRTAERVKQVAALNREIAERFASSITTSLNLITRLVNQSNVYGASGSYQQRSAGAVMINREA